MSSESLGWQPLLNAWKKKLPPLIEDVNKAEITSLFNRFCPVLLYFVRRCGATVNNNFYFHLFSPNSKCSSISCTKYKKKYFVSLVFFTGNAHNNRFEFSYLVDESV